MTYKITARKGNKKMNIKLESKHKYYNSGTTFYLYKPDKSQANLDSCRGYQPTTGNVEVLWDSNNNLILPQGTGESQRIGNKVNIKGINCVVDIYLNGTNIATHLSHGELIDFKTKWRMMAVKFKNKLDNPDTDIAKWFRETYIYTGTEIGTGINPQYQSVHLDKKRESTPWTGSFTILADKKFKLGKMKTNKTFNFNIKTNMDVNFENTNNKPTDSQKFSNIYIFIISPSNNWADTDAITARQLSNLALSQIAIGNCNMNIKTIYYDM